MNQDIFIALLKQFTRFVERLTAVDISNLSNGKKRLSIELVDGKKSTNEKISSINLQEIADSITKINSREDAEELVKDFKKADLLRLAKILDIPVQGNEDIVRLKEKVIESTVGFKLRSQAIQSTDS
jgi:hypothetical protein